MFRITTFTPHCGSCSQITSSTLNPRSKQKKTFKPHRFTAPSLAPLVVPFLANKDNPDIQTLKTHLEQYVRESMTDAFVRKVVKHAKELTSQIHLLDRLPALLEELEQLGFICGYETCDAAEMKKIMLARAKADYKLDKKQAEKDGIKIEEYKKPDVTGVDPNGKFVKCVWWIPPTTINMQAHGVVSNVSSCDAAHMSNASGVSEGTMYSMVGYFGLVTLGWWVPPSLAPCNPRPPAPSCSTAPTPTTTSCPIS